MKLTHAGTVKYPSGLIEITVVIHKSYTFLLESEYAHQKFLKEMEHQKYGAAINTLKRFNCKKKEIKMDTKDIYRAKIDKLTIRGGVTPEGKASIILGMPSAQKENVYVSLKIDDKEKLLAIVDCIFTTIAEAKLKKKNQTIFN